MTVGATIAVGTATTQPSQAAVLFADLAGSTKLYESEGDRVALDAVAGCLDHLRRSVQCFGGRVVKTIGDELMAVFDTPDAAAMAASGMQFAIEGIPPVGAFRLGVRIGFHSGPVIRREDDVFGDTVNLAARLTEQAGRNQIITSRDTADRLGPAFHAVKRPLYAIHLKGKSEDIELYELIWRKDDDDLTTVLAGHSNPAQRPQVLRVRYGDREVLRRRQDDLISLGRDPGCGLVISNSRASRWHCSIERRHDHFVLTDRSANGTYVTTDGAGEVLLRREEMRIGRHGWISFGQPRAEAAAVAEYFCD